MMKVRALTSVLVASMLCACASGVAPDEDEPDALDNDAWFGDVSQGRQDASGEQDSSAGGAQDTAPPEDTAAAPTDTGGEEDSAAADTAAEDASEDAPPPMDTATADTTAPDTAPEEDTAEPPLCGNGQRDPGEDCDPMLDGEVCPEGCEFNHAILCQPCSSDLSCGREIDRCVGLDDGTFCSAICVDDAWCPDGYTCEVLEGDVRGCLPDRGVCGDCFDPDGDGYGVGSGCRGEDCVENDGESFPGGEEVCDGVDNDCDGRVDEGVTPPTVWPDIDGDGFGSSTAPSVSQCPVPDRHVDNNADCNDGNRFIRPGAVEVCDNQDNNCVDGVDEGLRIQAWFDGDSDGYGDEDADPVMRCGTDANYADNNLDCDDSTEAANPGQAEVCDNIDNDCDDTIDEGSPTTQLWPDMDGDGYGDPNGAPQQGCTVGAGLADNDDDCDDTNREINPGFAEVCDGEDNNCGGGIDEGGICPCPTVVYGGHTYMYCNSPDDWNDARMFCINRGYHLAVINDAAENAWIRTTSMTSLALCSDTCRYDDDGDCDDGGPGYDYDYCDLGSDCTDCGPRAASEVWFGYYDFLEEGVFLWDSTPSSYTNWGSGEPNNSGNEDCAEMRLDTGQWNDKECDEPRPFVCESF